MLMNLYAIVPVKRFENAKTRLSAVLDRNDRINLSSLMLDDTLRILSSSSSLTKVIVVSSDKRAEDLAKRYGASFVNEERERGVNSAVALADIYCMREAADASIIVPHDLPLLDQSDIRRAQELAQNEFQCIVICPSYRYDGTNMLLRKPPSAIGTFYDSDSYNMHIKTAASHGISIKYFLSKTLMYDIDTPEDALQLIREGLNSTSQSIEFLKSRLRGI
jgi:2-phospho-L-lactate/phosphoenolpyruvate guanylyltransferase